MMFSSTGMKLSKALFVAALAWAAVLVASYLVWWLLGVPGREAIANTVGLSARELAYYVVAVLVIEKIGVKGLLVAALLCWLRGR